MLKRLLPIALLLAHPLVLAVDCQALYRQHLATDLTLPYAEFDQTPGKGMRPLAGAGCAKEAADLIFAYIDKNQDKRSSLKWHVALQDARAMPARLPGPGTRTSAIR